MRVAMYYNNRDVRIEDVPVPEIAESELLLKVKASGICGSDVMEWYRIKKAPLILGHEVTGQIVKVGSKVSRYKKADRIFVSHHVPCDNCRYCLDGNYTVCKTLHTTNFFPGGFSEYIRVPEINIEKGILVLPDNVSFEEGTFIEPLACVLRAQRLSQLKSSQSVVILGAGVSGLLHVIAAKAAHVSRIIVTDVNPYRLKIAKELGADAVIDAKDDVISGLSAANDNRLADLIIVCTSNYAAFEQALKAVDRAGTILCFAPTEPGVNLSVPVNDFWRQSIKIIHSYGASPKDNSIALEMLKTCRESVNKLITHRLSLNDAALGFKLTAEAKECLKVIIEPEK